MLQWLQRQPMPTPRHDLQAVAVGAEIYALSGADYATLDVVEIYDVATDTWKIGPSIPSRRGWFGAALLDGAIYVAGGKRIRSPAEKRESGDDAHFAIRDSVERLDLASGTWSSLAPLSCPRAGLVATVCQGKIYALGGNLMNGEPHLDLVEIYDPSTGNWSPAPPLPIGLQGPVVASIDDRIFITAGTGGPKRRVNDRTFVLDPDAGRWEERAPIPTARCDPGALAVGRAIYTFGGYGNGGYNDEVEIYDVDADTWSSAPPMPEKRAWMGCTLVEDRIFVMGGGLKLTDNPKTYKWFDELHEVART